VTRTATTEIVPVWRSDAQPVLLFSLFYDPTRRTAAAIAEHYGLARDTVSREARRLIAAGILRQQTNGRNHVLDIVEDHPAIAALRTLVDLTLGPLVDLRDLYEIDGVEAVYVFGSWARRHLGEPGAAPRDVDVLVVGSPDAFDVTSVCLGLSGKYGIEVTPMIINRREFDNRGDNVLLDDITSSQLVEVLR
jgi:predicted nucleotidyltransferase